MGAYMAVTRSPAQSLSCMGRLVNFPLSMKSRGTTLTTAYASLACSKGCLSNLAVGVLQLGCATTFYNSFVQLGLGQTVLLASGNASKPATPPCKFQSRLLESCALLPPCVVGYWTQSQIISSGKLSSTIDSEVLATHKPTWSEGSLYGGGDANAVRPLVTIHCIELPPWLSVIKLQREVLRSRQPLI